MRAWLLKIKNRFCAKPLEEHPKPTIDILEEGQDFYRLSLDWAYDRYFSQQVWLRRLGLAVAVLSALLALDLLSHLFLWPLKEKVPYLYSFNQATGEIVKLGALEPTTLQGEWQLTRFFLLRYVEQRESYHPEHLESPYQVTYAMTSPSLRAAYDLEVSSQNPQSPFKRYGSNAFITVKVEGIHRLNAHTAEVRFQKTLHERGSTVQQVAHAVAIIKWTYQKEPVTQKMLDRNPLGFQVTYYQVSSLNVGNDFE